MSLGHLRLRFRSGFGIDRYRDSVFWDLQDLSGLESKNLGQDERIDYIFLGLPGWGEWTIDPPADPDTDGIGTGMFAGRPNPFGSDCGASPLPVCWPSDHSGVQIDLNRH